MTLPPIPKKQVLVTFFPQHPSEIHQNISSEIEIWAYSIGSANDYCPPRIYPFLILKQFQSKIVYLNLLKILQNIFFYILQYSKAKILLSTQFVPFSIYPEISGNLGMRTY